MMPQGWQWIILLLIVLLLFGATRLPKLARSLGESAKIFKSEVRETQESADETEGDAQNNEATNDPTAIEGQVIDPTADVNSSRERRDHS